MGNTIGRMGSVAAIFVAVTALTVTAKAERWIVKNPKQTTNFESVRGLNFHSNITLNNNDYLIVDMTEKMSARELVTIFNAETAFEDMKIVIDKPIQTRPEPPPEEKVDAWHVKALEYSELNKKYTGEGVIVAVLDSGADYKHPALKSKMWKNTKEIPNNNIDDDHNGLVDDYDGYNFNNNLPDPMDTMGHGTHCSGIIAANKDPNSDAQGIAQNVRIMPLKIISDDSAGFLSSAAQAVKYATDNGAKVLSNSWRIYNSWTDFMNPDALILLHDAIQYAGDHGVIFVAAAGNERKNIDQSNLVDAIYPLALTGLKNMVGIASSSLDDIDGVKQEILSSYSNYGIKSIPVAAPGDEIYSTIPDGKWRFMSGTSMATPIVAGTLARGISKGYNMQEAISELNQTSKKSTYWQQYIMHGRIDVKKYLE